MEETSLLMPRVKAGPGKESPRHKLRSLLAVGAQGRETQAERRVDLDLVISSHTGQQTSSGLWPVLPHPNSYPGDYTRCYQKGELKSFGHLYYWDQ